MAQWRSGVRGGGVVIAVAAALRATGVVRVGSKWATWTPGWGLE